MTAFFLNVVDMSISASWIVLAVIAARLLLKTAPKWMHCALWALVAVRLVCPFSLESTLSLVPEFPSPQATAEETLPETVQNITWEDSAKPGDKMTVAHPNERGENEIYEVYLSEDGTTQPVQSRQVQLDWPHVACYVWLIGMAVMGSYAAVSYLCIHRKVSASIDLGNGVYLCDYIDTPFILGIAKPKIYLSSAMDSGDAAHVLAHERAHLKRKDHWWKPLGFTLLTVYWFNPLLWVAYILLCRDIELACDEKVVKDMAVTEKKAYSEALLKCSVPRHMILACPLAFGEVGVKQRVKSVLHYKKPGFWILLLSVTVILVVAMCFLTDPEPHTVANILDMRPEEIDQILLWSRTSRVDFETEEEIEEFLDFLETLEYDPAPAAGDPIEGDLDENNWSYYTIDVYYEDRIEYILFNYDYTLVWTRDADGSNSLPYHMKDPQRLLEYLNDHVTPVNNRETYAEPFARQDQPVQWLQGLRIDALRSASLHSYYLSNAKTQALIDVLNQIPETAVGNQRYDEDFSFDYRIQSMPSICLRDDANNLTGIFTYYNDSVELSLVGTSNYDPRSWKGQQYSSLICSIDSDALRSAFTELVNDPPDLLATSASGYIFNEKLETVSDGSFTMSFHTLENWDYEIIQPEDGEDFFGFRCKPKKEADGWITFGWWGDGFMPADTEEDTQSNLYGYHYTYTYNSPESIDGGETISIRYERAHCSHGSYVITAENTDLWAEWYQEVATWLPFFVNIKCETTHSLTQIPEDVASNLVNVTYYDWDSIARQIGAEHMTLFSPQYYEDYLFVGCQYGDDYRIACFRQLDAWDYAFVELLTPVSKFLPHDKTKVAPVAEFETQDSPWYLYILDDEAVTGVTCDTGFWGYIPVDSHPGLVVLDKALWGTDEEASVEFDLCYDEPPMLYFVTQTNGSIAEFSESPQHYLYDCLVNYNDGRNPPGSYSLDNSELKELADILVSLPELTENVFPENYANPFDITTADNGTPEVHMQLYLDETHLYMWSQDGIWYEDPGAFRLTLYYCDGSITLGVNMVDLGRDLNRDAYYYKVESAELEAFMLSKCDDSRKQHSLSTK